LDVKDHIRPDVIKVLREWETSKDIADIHNMIYRNKKILKDKMKNFSFAKEAGNMFIKADNFVNILKEVLFKLKLSNTQWRMIVNVADKEKSGMIDIDMFFGVINASGLQVRKIPQSITK
jgi:Ca2+-binding EF-hand superfamily protein